MVHLSFAYNNFCELNQRFSEKIKIIRLKIIIHEQTNCSGVRFPYNDSQQVMLINHCSTMHCCGNKLTSHDIFPNTVESPSFEPHFLINIGQFLMTSHACGGVITTAN